MKSILAFPLIWLSLSLNAQQIQLQGLITIQNSGYNNNGQIEFVKGAIIRANKAADAISRGDGSFTLTFIEKPFGSLVEINAIKDGLEVVNEKDLKAAAIIGRKVPLKIVMCKKGTLFENKIAYYNIAEKAILGKYEQRLKILSTEGKEKDQLIAQLEIELNRKMESLEQIQAILKEERNAALKMADQFANELAQINLDDASKRYIQAHEAFIKNDFERIIEILKQKELKADVLALQEEQKRIEKVDSLQNNRKQTFQEKKKDLVNSALLLAFAEYNTGNFKEAEEAHELAIEADPDNYQTHQSYMDLLTSLQRFDKVLPINLKATAIAKTDQEKAHVFHRLGYVYGQLDYEQKGLEAMQKAEQYYALFYDTTKMERDLAYFYRDLAFSYGANNQMQRKIDLLKKAAGIWESIIDKKKSICEACDIMEVSRLYGELCANYHQINQKEKGQIYCDKEQSFGAELLNNIDDSFVYTGEAIDQQFMNLIKRLSAEEELNMDTDSAIGIFFKLFEVKEQQIVENRAIFLPDIAYNYSNIARKIHNLEAYEYAVFSYEKAFDLFKELNDINPEQYNADILFCLKGLADIHIKESDTLALINVLERLCTAYDNIFIKDPLKSINDFTYDIGHLMYLYQTRRQFREANQLNLNVLEKYQNLHATYPNEAFFAEAIPRAYGSLAWSHLFSGDYKKAEKYALEGLQKAPEEKWIYTNLGHAYLFQNQLEKADSIYQYLIRLSEDSIFISNPINLPYYTVLYRDFSDFQEVDIIPEALSSYIDALKTKCLLKNLWQKEEAIANLSDQRKFTGDGNFLFLGTGDSRINQNDYHSGLALFIEKTKETIRISGTFDNDQLFGKFIDAEGSIKKSEHYDWNMEFKGQLILGQNDSFNSPVIRPNFEMTLFFVEGELFGNFVVHEMPPYLPEETHTVIQTILYSSWE